MKFNIHRLWIALTPRVLLVCLLFIGVFARAFREANDPDMWWHLATGRYIVEEGRIPKVDVFSYTSANRPWITHEWLTDVGMYALYRVAGKASLILVPALIVLGVTVLLYLQCTARPYIAVFATLVGVFTTAVSWGARPQLLNVLFLALLMYIIEQYRGGRSWTVWLLPPLTALWSNSHAGFMLAPFVVGVVLAGDGLALLIKHTSSRTLSFPRWRMLAIVFFVCVGAALLNPNGVHMLTYSFDTLGSAAMQTYITEWASPNFQNPGFWPFALLLLGGSTLLILARQRIELTDLTLFMGFAFAGLLSARHTPLFAVIAPPVITRAVAHKQPVLAHQRNVPALNWLILVLALVATGLNYRQTLLNDRVQEMQLYPQAALNYLVSQGWDTKPGYNDYNWGGYLIWAGIPVFIDGRADVHGDALMREYVQTLHIHENWRAPLDKYGVEYVLIGPRTPLGVLLKETAEWKHVYRDDVAVIFVREE